MRAKSVMGSACEGGAREEPERRLDRRADQRREDDRTDPDVTSQAKPATSTVDSISALTQPSRKPVRCAPTSISESRGPAPSAAPM